MNRGLSPELKIAQNKSSADFKQLNFLPLPQPNPCPANQTKGSFVWEVEADKIKISEPNWVAGFIAGEGSFQIDIKKSKTCRNKHQVLLRFSVAQHIRDELLLKSFIYYLDCGRVYKNKSKIYNTEFIEYRVEKDV